MLSQFEPLDKIDFKILLFKTVLLLALASAKHARCSSFPGCRGSSET